ncbi:uncharacterized protein F4822DRAFT_424474 [Hypoxylon trugodes]|uniref:uncharacterized protein n=1 Tax=Hypoxylon trugodes TaxID=326681 RepID=UPI00219BC197|nr:uncharacterized protein F4822DRAFT_424474 [Hypoxylon trugodes]KAI1394017.1 hypothetical protein F4822DRAFT_424474 [Hypoxylon trugodes]
MPVILVTGGNRGIGYAIVQALGTRIRDATILVGCRSVENAREPIMKLKELGIPEIFEPVEIDITDDASIKAAVQTVEEGYGKLDVLVNNAGAVTLPKSDDLTELRNNWTEGFNCLVTSQVLVTKAFLPLLRKAEWGRVVMISSARGSLARNKSIEKMPPTQHWLYNCSKAALNLVTIEFRNAELREVANEMDRITIWAASPGSCKTGFNSFRGMKDPLEGAEVTARLLESRRLEIPSGTFWEFEQGNFQQVPW